MCTIYAGISTSLIDHGRSTTVAVPRTPTPRLPHRDTAEAPRGRRTTPRAYRLRLPYWGHRRCRFPRLTPSTPTTSWLHRRLSARTNPVASVAPSLPLRLSILLVRPGLRLTAGYQLRRRRVVASPPMSLEDLVASTGRRSCPPRIMPLLMNLQKSY